VLRTVRSASRREHLFRASLAMTSRSRAITASPAILGTDEPTLSEADGVRYLHFGTEWIQGAMRMARPDQLVLTYTQQMMAWLLFADPPGEDDGVIGLLGLGAGSLARFCLRHTESAIHAVEWNPQVSNVCRTFFRLPPNERLTISHDDAARWVADPRHAGRCPVLMVDLYDAQASGPVRDSTEFYRDCRRVLGGVSGSASGSVLEKPGVLSVNLFGHHESFPRNIANLTEAFDGRLLTLPDIDEGNRIVLAFSGPALAVAYEQFQARATVVEARYGLPAKRWGKVLWEQMGNFGMRI